jgi:alkylated DNA nucleotide flippase Atl1
MSSVSGRLYAQGFLLIVRHRQVGICLKHLPVYSADADHFFHTENVPWQRVINSKGVISPRYGFLMDGE